LKVLINAISAKQGGILTYTRNLMPALIKRGIDATFAVPVEFEAVADCPLIRLDTLHFNAATRFAWEQVVWRSIVKRNNPDVLFSSANFSLLFPPVPQILLLREGGLFDPFYLANFAPSQGIRLSLLRRARRKMMLISTKHADLIMTPTAELRESVLRWAPEMSQRCVANHYGTLETTFGQTSQQRPWREDGTLRLLYVSIYYAHKNPGTLVRATLEMAGRNANIHTRITMTPAELESTPGSAQDAILMRQGVESGLITTGRHPYDKLPELYQQSDVFVFPSVSETFGHPMVEALASGMPLVVAEHPVNREICGDAALYFSPFSSADLTDKLQQLDKNPELRQELGCRGRQRVLDLFTWDAHVDRLCALFEQVASTKAKPHTRPLIPPG